MLEKCKNTMTYSYIECKSPLSQLMLGEGRFRVSGGCIIRRKQKNRVYFE